MNGLAVVVRECMLVVVGGRGSLNVMGTLQVEKRPPERDREKDLIDTR